VNPVGVVILVLTVAASLGALWWCHLPSHRDRERRDAPWDRVHLTEEERRVLAAYEREVT
jgi:hypothetical protein